MREFIRITANNLQLSPDTKILRKDDYQTYLNGQDIIDNGISQSKKIIDDAIQLRDKEAQKGYEEGLKKAEQEKTQAIFETLQLCENYIMSSKKELASIVSRAVRKIVEEFDNQELVIKTIQRSLSTASGVRSAKLRVAPVQRAFVQEKLSELLKSFPEMSQVDVISDDRVEAGGCLLETKAGVLDGTIDNQLLAIETAIQNQFSESTQNI